MTSIRWKPGYKTIVLAVSTDGLITQLHSLTGKSLYQMKEKGNQIMCVDYSNDGNYFATCGDDKTMRLYDDNTKMVITDFPTISATLPEITNRLYAVRFSPMDSNILIGGGWDSTIHIFDIRQSRRVNYIYGPHICGDGIDIKNSLLLTTSWSGRDQVVIWDLKTMKAYLKINVSINDDNGNGMETNLYAGRFNQSENTFAIAGSNRDIIRVYNYNTDSDLYINDNDNTLNCHCDKLEHPCYSIDFSSKGNQMIYSGYDSLIRIVDIK